MKKFNITFTENKKEKYNPNTRTVLVEAKDEFVARRVFAEKFDSMKFDKQLLMNMPTGNKVIIKDVIEIKEEGKDLV